MSFDFLKVRYPRTVSYGIKDNTKRTLPLQEATLPQGIPLIYFFAEKGSTASRPYNGANAAIQFGDASFDELSKFFNHPTELRNLAVAKASATCVYRRLVPKDAGPKANVTLWMDVLETMIPNYLRNSDGSFKMQNDLKVIDVNKPYIHGTLIKWYTSSAKTEISYGQQKATDGSMCRWNFYQNDENVRHILKSTRDLSVANTGNTDLANCVVYQYENQEAMFEPENGFTVREKYNVDAEGVATKDSDELFESETNYVIKSKMYPIIECKAAFQGEYYNRVAFSIAPSEAKMTTKDIKELKAIPYTLTRYLRKGDDITPTIYQTQFASNSSDFTFVENGLDPSTKADISFESVLNSDTWDVEGYEEVEHFEFYRDNYIKIVRRLCELEAPYVSFEDKLWADDLSANTSGWYPFTDVDNETVMSQFMTIDPFRCKTKQGVPYFTIMTDFNKPEVKLRDFEEQNMTANLPIYLKNGSDGTTSYENLEALILEDLDNYMNDNHKYMNMFVSPENLLFDTGFSRAIKKKFKNFIAKKKNTIVFLSHHDMAMGRSDYSLEEIDAITKSLYAELKLCPESDYYNTSTVRAYISAGTGAKKKGGKRYPLVFDVAIRVLKLMGGGERRWDVNERFDIPNNHDVVLFKDVHPQFIPPAVKNTLWNNGVTYPEAGDNGHYFPVHKTVYGDDTSALNTLINILPVPFLERVALEVWKESAGRAGESNAMFKSRVEKTASSKLLGAFGGIVTVTPTCVIDDFDRQTGYTWHLNFHVEAYTTKHIQIVSTIYETPLESK